MRRYKKPITWIGYFYVVRKNLDFFLLKNLTVNQTLHQEVEFLLQDVMIFIFKDINVTKARFVCDRQFEACQVFVNSDFEWETFAWVRYFFEKAVQLVVSDFILHKSRIT